MIQKTSAEDDEWWVQPCPHHEGSECNGGYCTQRLLYAHRRITKAEFEKRVNDCPYRRGGYKQDKLL